MKINKFDTYTSVTFSLWYHWYTIVNVANKLFYLWKVNFMNLNLNLIEIAGFQLVLSLMIRFNYRKHKFWW